MSVGANIQPISINNFQPKRQTSFRGKTVPVQDYLPDTLEIKGEKKTGLSKSTKVGIGIGAGILTLVGGALAFVKFVPKMVSKFYNKNLILSNLPERIEFKEALTLDEAIKFAKEVLGIKNIDKNFDNLEALNYINKAIVDVSNAHKGKLYIPSSLNFEDIEGNVLAYMDQSLFRKSFGTLSISKKMFDNKALDETLQKFLFKKDGKDYFMMLKTGEALGLSSVNHIMPIIDKDTAALVQKFYNKKTLTVQEKRILISTIEYMKDLMYLPSRTPLKFLANNKAEFEKVGIKIDIDAVSKMNAEEQLKIFKEKMDEYAKIAKRMYIKVRKYNPDEYIYHEMGHLQDYGKNLRELSDKDWKFEWGNKYKSNKQDLVNDRWGSIEADESFAKLLKDNPSLFKEQYPNMYEFLTNKNYQQTAGLVSDYAQSGIGEFIAETYSKLITGKKLPDDVMALYKKYNGPMI